MHHPDFSIDNFIVCEQIRTESYNKLSLLGVYSNRTILIEDEPPVQLPLALYLVIRINNPEIKKEKMIATIAIYNPDKTVMAKRDVEIKAPPQGDSDLITFTLNLIDFPIAQTGDFKFSFKINKKALGDFDITISKVQTLLKYV